MFHSLWLKLRLYTLWLRWVRPFNWAHHPLCERFQNDVLRLGSFHVCRSCVAAYTGMLLTCIVCWLRGEWLAEVNPLWIVGSAGVTVIGSLPQIYERMPRVVRDVLRASMGMLIALAATRVVSGDYFIGIPMVVILTIFWYAYFQTRKRRRLRACEGCPELDGERVCSGFSLQVARIRCYEEAATDLVEQYGPMPVRNP